MESKIDIYYSPFLYEYNDFLSKLIEYFNICDNSKKDMILNRCTNNKIRDNICNNIELLKLINLNYCIKCNKYADYIGFCIEHFNQTELNKYVANFYNFVKNLDENKSIYINNYLKEYKENIWKNSRKIKEIIKYYNTNFFFSFILTDDYLIKYIDNKYNIDYDNINVIFNDKISYNIITKFNYTEKRELNLIILLTFLCKKYEYDKYIYDIIIKNKKFPNVFIGNNNILYNYIFNSNIINNIEFMDTEYLVHIDNHPLRFDIYIIIKIFDGIKYNHHKLIIETDEKHHYVNNNNYDILKDKYCIQNQISLLRLHISNNKISINEINFCMFFIKYLIKHKGTIYYFSEKYISSHKIKINSNENNDNLYDILSFGTDNRDKKYYDYINKINNISNIKNIDKYIKTSLHLLIDKFSLKNNFNEEEDNLIDEEINNMLKSCNLYRQQPIINFHK